MLYVQRKTLTGESEAYEFDVIGIKFLVKNLSDADAFVNYEPITSANEMNSIKIPKSTAQIVLNNEYNSEGTKTVYVKGTGDVEVQVILW